MKNVDINLTRNDLIEYAISKRVEEIKVLKAQATKEYNTYSKEANVKIKKLEEQEKEIRKVALEKFIQDNYKETIELMEKNLGCPAQIFTADTDHGKIDRMLSELLFILRLKSTEAVVVFIDKSIDFRGSFKHMRHPMDMMFDIKSFIRIDASKLEIEELKPITAEIKSLKDESTRLYNVSQDYLKQIEEVKSQKDIIKNALVEQALNQSEEGIALLGVLNNLDINGMKALK